jgi:hypothetical protein
VPTIAGHVLAAITILGGWSAPVRPTQAQTSPGTAVILGGVVDAATNAPIASVLVTLSPAAPAEGRQPQRAITGASGRFAFRNVPAGSYTLTTTVGGNGYSPGGFIVTGLGHLIGGYLNGGYGQRRPDGPLRTLEVRAGARVADAVIRMWKGAAIDGSVFDESGEPLVGVVVAVVRVSSDGRLLTGPTTKTDDRGRYHVGALAPGNYVVVVPQLQVTLPKSTIDDAVAHPDDRTLRTALTGSGAPAPAAGGILAGDRVLIRPPPVLVTNSLAPAVREDGMHVYPTTFHSSSAALEKAATVTLRSGEEREGIDVHLRPVRAVTVSGLLIDDAGPVGNFAVRLVPAAAPDGSSQIETAMTASDAAGRFTFPLVPPGQYRVIAERPPAPIAAGGELPPTPRSTAERPGAWAARSVNVGDRAVQDIDLILRPGLIISGRTEFQGAAPRLSADRLTQGLRLAAVGANRLPAPVFRPTVDSAGTIIFDGVPPGRYVLRAMNLGSWSLQQVTVAGRDFTDTVFDVGEADVETLQVTFTDRAAALSGTVPSSRMADLEDAAVFVFPEDRTRWRDARVSAMTFRTVRVAGAGGTFGISNLPAGSYFAVAAPDSQAGDWPDTAFLARLASGASVVRIDPGQQATVALRLIEIR